MYIYFLLIHIYQKHSFHKNKLHIFYYYNFIKIAFFYIKLLLNDILLFLN